MCILCAGGIFLYVEFQVVMWWLFHTTIIFWGVMRPWQYQVMKKSGRMKYIHLTMGVMGVTLPLIPVLICNWIGGFGLNLLLQYRCFPTNRSAIHYSILVPFDVITITSLAMLVATLSTIAIRVRCVKVTVFQLLMFINLQARNDSKENKKQQAEIKLLVIIIFHCLFVFYVTTVFSLNSWKAPEIIAKIFAYFSCEANGIQLGKTCEYENVESYTITNAISYVWISNITVINALYVVNILNIKTKVKTHITTKLCLK